MTLLLSVPGVGRLLAAHLLVVTNGFRREVTARQLSAYIGIGPYDHPPHLGGVEAARA